MLWATSPACTELETHVLDWLVEMLGLPDSFRSDRRRRRRDPGHGLQRALCARCWRPASGPPATPSNERGCDGRLVAYTSTQAHSSIEKAVTIAGLGREQPAPDRGGRALRHAPRRAGRGQIAARPRGRARSLLRLRHGGHHLLQRHRPAAGDRRDLPRARASGCTSTPPCPAPPPSAPSSAIIHDGLELADSYCFNPHKWMFTNFDCDCFYVADRARADPRP